MRNILLDVRHFPWLYKAEFVAGLLLQLLGILQILLLRALPFHPSAGPCPAVSHAPAFSAEQSDNSGCLVQRCIRILKRRKRISASRCPEKGASEKAFSSYYACGALYARASLPSTWFTNLYTLGSAAISASYFSLALAARNP